MVLLPRLGRAELRRAHPPLPIHDACAQALRQAFVRASHTVAGLPPLPRGVCPSVCRDRAVRCLAARLSTFRNAAPANRPGSPRSAVRASRAANRDAWHAWTQHTRVSSICSVIRATRAAGSQGSVALPEHTHAWRNGQRRSFVGVWQRKGERARANRCPQGAMQSLRGIGPPIECFVQPWECPICHRPLPRRGCSQCARS